MLVTIDNFLTAEEAAAFRARLDAGTWVDGAGTAGTLSAAVKRNLQIDENDPLGRDLGNIILGRMGTHPLAISAALPHRIYPPKFNSYAGGGHYGTHVDSAVMRIPGTNDTLRSDVSATLFLTDPADYDGGELLIEGAHGAQAVKLEAGALVLYPATSLHRVEPVTRGRRICSFFWIQSMVRSAEDRGLLFDLDQTVQALAATRAPDDADLVRLTGVYHNLLRRWAEI